MKKVFDEDSPLVMGVLKFMELLLANTLWLLTSVPLLTIGPASAALYDVVYKDIWHGRGTVVTDYFRSFRRNFRTAFPAGLLFLLGTAFFAADIHIFRAALASGRGWGNAWVLFALFLALWSCWFLWLIAGLAMFDSPVKVQMKNALVLLFTHAPVSLSAIGILGAGILAVWLIPAGLFLIPVLCEFLICVLFTAVFRRYMTEEQRQAEDERNNSWRNVLRESREKKRETKEEGGDRK